LLRYRDNLTMPSPQKSCNYNCILLPVSCTILLSGINSTGIVTAYRICVHLVDYSFTVIWCTVLQCISVQASNLLVGLGQQGQHYVHLVDFGLCSKYMVGGIHKQYTHDLRLVRCSHVLKTSYLEGLRKYKLDTC
jgi:hypothetical protein